MNKAVKSSGKNTSVISIRVDTSKFEKLDNQLSNLSGTSVNSSGKLGITKGELLEQLLDNYLSNEELKDFINGDFRLQTSAQNRRIDDLTVVINSLTKAVENLRNLLALTLSNGDVNAALSVINTVNSPAVVREMSGEDDFEFTTEKRADNDHFQNDDTSDLLAAFEQINVSNDSENGADNSRVVTSFQTLKQPRNFKKRLNT